MTPAARVQAAIDILSGLEASALPADRFIREFFRARRYAGSKDRAAVSEAVYGILRGRGVLAWQMGDDSPRALALAWVAREGSDVDLIFTSEKYAPAAITEEERRALKATRGEPPLWTVGAFPAFLEGELTRAFGDPVLREMTAMLARAPVDLRVNTLKETRDDVLDALRADGFEADATPWSPMGIRLGTANGLEKTPLFARGAFEFQDEAAQIAAMLVAPRAGERIFDLTAGAGGKSLALAALAHNEAEIVASDIRPQALQQLQTRAERAGAMIAIDPAPRRQFDAVLLDAPCSGTGTWRRQPELRWRLTASRLDQLNATQDELLARAAAHVRPNGRLIYATCSILPRENEDRIAAFLRSHPAFHIVRADSVWRESAKPPGLAEFFRASPLTTGTDGFFAAILQRE